MLWKRRSVDADRDTAVEERARHGVEERHRRLAARRQTEGLWFGSKSNTARKVGLKVPHVERLVPDQATIGRRSRNSKFAGHRESG
jgi:hypothetical protein